MDYQLIIFQWNYYVREINVNSYPWKTFYFLLRSKKVKRYISNTSNYKISWYISNCYVFSCAIINIKYLLDSASKPRSVNIAVAKSSSSTKHNARNCQILKTNCSLVVFQLVGHVTLLLAKLLASRKDRLVPLDLPLETPLTDCLVGATERLVNAYSYPAHSRGIARALATATTTTSATKRTITRREAHWATRALTQRDATNDRSTPMIERRAARASGDKSRSRRIFGAHFIRARRRRSSRSVVDFEDRRHHSAILGSSVP